MATPSKIALRQTIRNSAPLQQVVNMSLWIDQVQLAANTAEGYTVPVGITKLRIRVSTGLVYCNPNGTAVIPVADKVDGTGSFQVDPLDFFDVDSGTVLSFIGAGTSVLTVEAWA